MDIIIKCEFVGCIDRESFRKKMIAFIYRFDFPIHFCFKGNYEVTWCEVIIRDKILTDEEIQSIKDRVWKLMDNATDHRFRPITNTKYSWCERCGELKYNPTGRIEYVDEKARKEYPIRNINHDDNTI